MRVPSLQEALDDVPAGGALTATLGDQPLDELLFTLHTGRFTGALRVGRPADRVYLREGAVVGLVPPPKQDVEGLAATLVQLKLLSRETLAAVWEDCAPEDGVALVRALLDAALLSPDAVTRATEEHARRRLFALYDRPPETEVEAALGPREPGPLQPGLPGRAPRHRLRDGGPGRRGPEGGPGGAGAGPPGGPAGPLRRAPELLRLPRRCCWPCGIWPRGCGCRADGALPGLSPAETAGCSCCSSG
jgi:hypothetical protein